MGRQDRCLRIPGGVAAMALIAAAAQADWPGWRGPNSNGQVAAADWVAPGAVPRTVWSAAVGAGYAAPTVAGGHLYIAGRREAQDVVGCLDAATGRELWTHAAPAAPGDHPGPRGCAVVDGDAVYFLDRDARAMALDRATGAVRWQRDLKADLGCGLPKWGVSGSPVVAGKALLLNVCTAGAALDKATGKTLWASAAGVCGYATPVVYAAGGTPRALIFGEQALSAVGALDGALAWTFPWKTRWDVNAADPVVDDGRAFISSGYDHGCALLDIRGAAPAVVWENKGLRSHFSSPVLYKGCLYGVDGNTGHGGLVCLKWDTGETVWREDAAGFGSLILVSGTIVYLSEKGNLILAPATPDGYTERLHAKLLEGICWTAPVFSDGRLYLRNDKGTLLGVDLRGKP